MRVLRPESESEAADIIAAAASAKQILSIEGGGSKRGLGRVVVADATLRLDALAGIVSYEPEELVITVRAGTPLREVEAVLAEKNQCLAFEPGSWSFDADALPTIGGTIAAGVAGARRVVLGGARDHIIGFRAINGEGTPFKAGGKVVKNVTGYDLPKLAAGSFGTLFVMTEVTLRTYPRTAAPRTLMVRDLDLQKGCAFMRRVAASPLEATALCYVPLVALELFNIGLRPGSLTLVRFEGHPESAEARCHTCVESLLHRENYVEFKIDERSDQLWSRWRQLAPFAGARTLWRISVPPSNAVGVVSVLYPDCYVIDWAGGLVWVEPGRTSRDDVHAVAREFGGHATLFRGPDEIRRSAVFQPLDPVTLALTRRLKAAFDPHGIFSPGRMYDGI